MEHAHLLLIQLTILLFSNYIIPAENGISEDKRQLKRNNLSYEYIGQIYDIYGYRQKKSLNLEGFEHLYKNLVSKVSTLQDHDIGDHYQNNEFVTLHGNHSQHQFRITLADEQVSKSKLPSIQDENSAMKKCIFPKDLLKIFDIESQDITHGDFFQLCPALLFQIDSHHCKVKTDNHKVSHVDDDQQRDDSDADDHGHDDNGHDDHGHDDPGHDDHDLEQTKIYSPVATQVQIWLSATIAVVIISVVGLFCVGVIPLMKRFFFENLLQFLIALAVGTLTGDALLHLLPHAMGGGHEHNDDKNSRKNIYLSGMVLVGIYFFFFAERLMELAKQKKINNEDSGDANGNTEKVIRLNENNDKLAMIEQSIDDDQSIIHTPHHHDHGHSHTVPNSISAMAYMVILGDGLHNLTDGLAIGAAFANDITAGMSTSIAIFCHELPHELGDFAILIKSGMSVKQSLICNIISSILAFIGMVIGVLVGNLDGASQWIFSMTAGMFIYIALVDMLPEMNACLRNAPKKYQAIILQAIGLAMGLGIMLCIALYEEELQKSMSP